MRILLIGAGVIADEYVKALKSLNCPPAAVLSRGRGSAEALRIRHGLDESFFGGMDTLQGIHDGFDGFIVATPVETLLGYVEFLTARGHERVLAEKPLVLGSAQLNGFLAEHPECRASVALNRLFYPSLAELRRRVADDPTQSATFSFTEWVHRIDPSAFDQEVLARWGVANCIHVIATVFDVIGQPEVLSPHIAGRGSLDWHPTGAIFTGAGTSRSGAGFSYHSNWQSAGRWSMTFHTAKGAYIMEPMEGLAFCPKGSVQTETLMPPYSGDTKCGFEEMLKAWLGAGEECARISLPSLAEHLETVETIMGYGRRGPGGMGDQ